MFPRLLFLPNFLFFRKSVVKKLRVRTAKTRKSASAYDLIQEPQATMKYDAASRELLWKRKPSSYQMCLISEDLAETFNESLHSIFFSETICG